MKCYDVNRSLSPYLDEVLAGDAMVQVSAHLKECVSCCDELQRLNRLRTGLASLAKVPAPDYLRSLIEMRVVSIEQRGWGAWLREAWQYRWSRIRTTEKLWYLTRILGTAMTLFFFLVLSSAMSPIYIDLPEQISERGGTAQQIRQQLGMSVLKSLGLRSMEAQRRPISPSEAMISDLHLLNFGQSAGRAGSDDSFSVVTTVDRSGAAKIENVLEYPADSTLLYNFNSMLVSARCRPASQNGRAVNSHLVLTFSKISVYD